MSRGLRFVGADLTVVDESTVVLENTHGFTFSGPGIVASLDPARAGFVLVTITAGAGGSLQNAYDVGEIITTTAADGQIEFHRGAGSGLAQSALLIDDVTGEARTAALLLIDDDGTGTGESLLIDRSTATGVALTVVGGSDTLRLKTHVAFSGSASNIRTVAVQTTDATATQLLTLTLSDNFVYLVEVSVEARDTSGVNRAAYKRVVCAFRQGAGVATIQGLISAPFTVETVGAIAWNATFTVSGNDLRVTVTGAAATTINWSGTIRYQRISGSA